MSVPESPEVLPVFPLTGVLLLPGGFLPLNIFERRYRNLVEDIARGHLQLGMIQPRTPREDGLGLDPSEAPELYSVGCVGVMEDCESQSDGRYLIVLRGVRRFRLESELPPERGYRRVRAEYGEFESDAYAAAEEEVEIGALLRAVDRFSRRHELEFDRDLLSALPASSLINGLAAALPFLPGEKQALLEASTSVERRDLLLTLMEMGVDPAAAEDRYLPPVVH